MSTLALNYDSIDSAVKNIKKVSSETNDYVSALQKKLINKIDELPGDSTTYTTQVKTNVEDKVKSLQAKQTSYNDYADKLKDFINKKEVGAKAVDSNVAKRLKTDTKSFCKMNNIKVSVASKFFTFLATELSNAGDFARGLVETVTNIKNWLVEKWGDLKDWFRYDGGKYVMKAIGSIASIVVSVVVIVATAVAAIATGAIGIVAIAAIIGAVIAIVDGGFSFVNSCRAYAGEGKDPAQALKTSKVDKASTWLRTADHGSKLANTLCNIGANALDITETVCAVIGIVSTASNLAKKLPVLKNFIGNKSQGLMKLISVTGKDGKQVVTFKSLRNGLKTLFTSSGERTRIFNKFKGDLKFNFGSLKDTLRYEWHSVKTMFTELKNNPASRIRFKEIYKNNIIKNIKDLIPEIDLHKIKGVQNLTKGFSKGIDAITKALKTGDTGLKDKFVDTIKSTFLDGVNSTHDYMTEILEKAEKLKKDISGLSSKYENVGPEFSY